ncbi:Pollen Ole e 1 allergen and extensin family protein [Striga hermonthica]|uniref:Pollen Ole e 1 allergen and extensin family protein n=1 Tax=Striga hermonthica TaxID=68872 RepID=A0A9N7NZE1_STRHE|nr:Pollen Ole e 1 allergen and extensin family protein [Striga hermonthica]
MAITIITKAILIFLFVTIISTSTTEAQAQPPSRLIGIIHVNGTLYCSTNGANNSGGNGNTTPFFPNATVQVACTVDVIANSPENATTDGNGAYRVVLIPRPNATISSIVSDCRVFVLTPLSSCNRALPSSGLVSGLQFVRTVPNLFWYITYMVASGFAPQA